MKAGLLFIIILIASLSHGFSQDLQLEERLKTHVRILSADSLEGRGLGTAGSIRARNYLVEQFAEAGIRPFGESYIQPFSFRQGVAWIPGENIIGYVEGSDPVLKNEFILIGAHYDHLGYQLDDDSKVIYSGADDNASGVASIIEIGRFFATNGHLLKRSLIIAAFDAEESGLHGSTYLANHPPVELSKIRMMFSLDMVGMYSANKGLDLIGIASFTHGETIAENLAAEQTISLQNTSGKIVVNTDTAPFGAKGIPSVHVFTGMNSPYHKPEDKWQLLDYEGMNLINNYLVQLIGKISVTPEITPSASVIAHAAKSEKTHGGISLGYLLNTGTGFHEYKNEFYQAKQVFNMSTGFSLEIPLSPYFSLQPELLYDLNGSKIAEGNFYRHSLTMPLNLQFGSKRSEVIPVRFYTFGGFYYRYNLTGKIAGEKINYTDSYARNEWGYNFGMAMDVFRFTAGFTMRKGLTRLTKNGLPEIFDRSRYFTFGYRF